MYLGIEAEGELKGLLTLFIDKINVSGFDIIAILNKYPEIEHVYFGARGNYGISMSHAVLLEAICVEKKLQVTIETNDLSSLPEFKPHENIRIVLTVKFKDVSLVHNHNVYVKIEDDSELFVFYDHLHTRIDNLLYTLDKELS